jgi:hypothetical protein
LQGNLNKNSLAKGFLIKVKSLVKLYLYKNEDILIKMSKTFISSRDLIKDIKVSSIIIYVTGRVYIYNNREGYFNKKNQLKRKKTRLYALNYLYKR